MNYHDRLDKAMQIFSKFQETEREEKGEECI